MQLKFAPRYAKALMEISQEQGKLDTVYNDMCLINESINQSIELKQLLQSPIVSIDKKSNSLNAIFENRVDPLTMIFLQTTLRKKREMHLLEISDSFIENYRNSKQIKKIKLTSAQALDQNTLNEIVAKVKTQLKAEEVIVTTAINEKLIGGFVLEYEDKIFDASILYDLKHISKQFEDNIYIPKI